MVKAKRVPLRKVCSRCGKRCYPSEAEGWRDARAKPSVFGLKPHVYPCPGTTTRWHITTNGQGEGKHLRLK